MIDAFQDEMIHLIFLQNKAFKSEMLSLNIDNDFNPLPENLLLLG